MATFKSFSSLADISVRYNTYIHPFQTPLHGTLYCATVNWPSTLPRTQFGRQNPFPMLPHSAHIWVALLHCHAYPPRPPTFSALLRPQKKEARKTWTENCPMGECGKVSECVWVTTYVCEWLCACVSACVCVCVCVCRVSCRYFC